MQKRRVGVTAESRLIVENQATGTPQIASEIAAPLVSRTPMGTVATATIECGWKRGDTTGGQGNRAESSSDETDGYPRERGKWRVGQRAEARMRRCLKLRQGAKPPETPAPFPSGHSFQNGRNLSRVRKPRTKRAPLTDSFRSEDSPGMRERGPLAKRAVNGVGSEGSALRAHEALPHPPPGGKPPETPNSCGGSRLTEAGLLMEAATERGSGRPRPFSATC
jgi:hypothetical protein